jgi:hypothetical protein
MAGDRSFHSHQNKNPGNRMKQFRHGVIPALLVAAVYLIAAILVDPRGEFPLNDDWSYSRTAFRFAESGNMKVDEWSAPNLIGQAFYGGLLLKLVGKSLTALRVSSLVLAWILACALWGSLSRLGLRKELVWVLILSWVFNPVGFCLSFTFMTEIPFLVFATAALWMAVLFFDEGKGWQMAACGGLLGYAYTIRQTAVLFLVPLALVLLALPRVKGFGSRIINCLRLVIPAGIFIMGYYLWSAAQGGSTPAAQRKFELLRHLTATQLIGNSFGLLYYLAFFLLPVSCCLLPGLFRLCATRPPLARLWVPAWTAASACGIWWFSNRFSRAPDLPGLPYHPKMPFLLNVLYDTGLGPLTLDPTYYGRTPTPNYPHVWQAVTILSAVSLVILGLFLALSLPSAWSRRSPAALRAAFLSSGLAFLIIAGFEIVFSHVQEGGLFDRHLLTAELPLMLMIGCAQASVSKGIGDTASAASSLSGKSQLHSIGLALAAVLLIFSAAFSVAGTHDYLAWNRVRWALGKEVLAEGIDPLKLSGGFEFNGWHNYDAFRKRGNISKIYYWWYDSPEYVIAMEPQEEYTILRKREYFSWLHRRNQALYVLRRSG